MDVTDWSYINSREKKLNSGKNWYDSCMKYKINGCHTYEIMASIRLSTFLQSVYVRLDHMGKKFQSL